MPSGGDLGRPDRWTPAPGRLSAEEREEIMLGLAWGEKMAAIARSLGRATSTITREVEANGGPLHYRAWKAHCRAEAASRRPKPAKLAHPPLVRRVTTWLEEAVVAPGDRRALAPRVPGRSDDAGEPRNHLPAPFVQGRGELRRELARCLRSGRTARRHQGRVEKRGKNPDMVMISDRPAEIEDRAVPGHWEGDLIIGAGGKSAVGTRVERSTRFVLLLPPPRGITERKASRRPCVRPSGSCPRSWPAPSPGIKGHEMAGHVNFTVATGIPIYFCDPHSPWQTRIEREYERPAASIHAQEHGPLPAHSAADLAHFQRSLNGRPRKTLGYMKPSEKFAELVALTARIRRTLRRRRRESWRKDRSAESDHRWSLPFVGQQRHADRAAGRPRFEVAVVFRQDETRACRGRGGILLANGDPGYNLRRSLRQVLDGSTNKIWNRDSISIVHVSNPEW